MLSFVMKKSVEVLGEMMGDVVDGLDFESVRLSVVRLVWLKLGEELDGVVDGWREFVWLEECVESEFVEFGVGVELKRWRELVMCVCVGDSDDVFGCWDRLQSGKFVSGVGGGDDSWLDLFVERIVLFVKGWSDGDGGVKDGGEYKSWLSRVSVLGG